MQALLDAVVDLVALVSPSKVGAIATAVRDLSPTSPPNLRTLVGTPAARAAVAHVLATWGETGVTGHELAGMLQGAAEARRRTERELSVDLVWTGPTTPFVPTRRTEQVLIDLISTAEHDLFLVSFVAYDVPGVARAMNDAATRGVRVRTLLEASTAHGGTLSVDPAATMRSSVPGAEIYTWKERSEPFVDGKVHAKVAVVDEARAFITSANLTGHALEKNMEAGVLINGGPGPKTLSDHLEGLINVGIIAPA